MSKICTIDISHLPECVKDVKNAKEIGKNTWGRYGLVECPSCKTQRWLLLTWIVKPEFTGMCQSCHAKIKAPHGQMKGKHHSLETKAKLSAIEKQQKELHQYWLGKHISEETKTKISLANKGHKHTEEHKESISRKMKGVPKSEEARNNIKEATIKMWQDIDYIQKHSGENNSNWLGGISYEPYTKEFNRQLKLFVRTRDNFTCQLCKIPEKEMTEKLTSHHIDYDKKNCLPINLISLCRSCHTKTNHKREYCKTYLSNILTKPSFSPTVSHPS
jgi:hypothetical protein